MCGIAGTLSKKASLITQQRIKAVTDAIAHRGPEGEGFFINNQNTVALGHRRLSIIDLSGAAAQPMQYRNQYYIVYNGEVYNYIELRSNLQKKGHIFKTASDTEVVVAAYAAWGKDCVQHFDGMFAFAIWDEKEQQLFAARDRFGEKPFYYFFDEEQLLFASEIKALWKGGVCKEVNPSLLYNFLTIGYTSNPTDPAETFYSNIQKLPAAFFLQYSLQTHSLVIEKYWQLEEKEEEMSDKEAIELFNELFASSVKRRLRSDVAIGTSLSGGLDSSAIVAFCANEKIEQYTHACFTAVFPGFEKNEEQFAAKIALHFNLQHHLVTVPEGDIAQQIEQLLQHHDEPVGSGSVLVQYHVYKRAKQQGITVLLDGQGGDEVLGGYHKYYKWRWQELYAQKNLKKSGERRAAKELGIKEGFGVKNKATALFPHFAAAMLQTEKSKKAYRQSHLNNDFAFAHKRDSYYSLPTHFTLNGALYFDTIVYGLEELLRLADRNSMAHSVEVRLPFLAHQLVEALFSLPAHFKIREGWTKWLLRKTAEPFLPPDIVWRKDKVGFEPPQKTWMKAPDALDAVQAGKALLVKEGILNSNILNQKVQPHEAYAAEPFDWRYWSASWLFRQ